MVWLYRNQFNSTPRVGQVSEIFLPLVVMLGSGAMLRSSEIISWLGSKLQLTDVPADMRFGR